MYRALETPPPLREQVYVALEELILEGRLCAGHRLIESELAEQLRVSRGPIREALQLLERDGWLEAQPRRGTYVRATTEEELDDYFRARNLLEVEACRLAACRVRDEFEVTAATIEELEHRVERSRILSDERPDEELTADASRSGLERRRQYRENSREIHRLIAQLSGNDALAELIEYVSRRTRWYFASSAAKHREDRRLEHRELLDALVEGDDELAAVRMYKHLDRLRNSALEALRREGAPG